MHVRPNHLISIEIMSVCHEHFIWWMLASTTVRNSIRRWLKSFPGIDVLISNVPTTQSTIHSNQNITNHERMTCQSWRSTVSIMNFSTVCEPMSTISDGWILNRTGCIVARWANDKNEMCCISSGVSLTDLWPPTSTKFHLTQRTIRCN